MLFLKARHFLLPPHAKSHANNFVGGQNKSIKSNNTFKKEQIQALQVEGHVVMYLIAYFGCTKTARSRVRVHVKRMLKSHF